MLTVALLLGWSLLTLFGSPYLLSRGHWRVRRPRLCLVSWFTLFTSGLVATIGAVVVAVALGMRAHTAASAGSAIGPTGDFLLAWLALAASGGALSLVLTKVGSMVAAERQLRADFARLVESASYRHEVVRGLKVTFISSQQPIACTLRGRSPEIMISSRLDDHLRPQEIRAVIEHERAHVRGRHDLITRAAALNCACLPVLLAPRELRRATALLIELIADDRAARSTSAEDVAAALRALGELRPDPSLGLRARRVLGRASVSA